MREPADAAGAAGSVAVRDLLTGPPREGRVVAAFPSAIYVAAGGNVVALVTADGVRLPNALVLAADTGGSPFRGVAPGAPATVGSGGVATAAVKVRVGRWWDPRPRLGTVDPTVLATRATEAGEMVGPAPGSGVLLARAGTFARACRAGGTDALEEAGDRLLGLGDGLTPAGDDLLAGALAGWRLFGDACGGAVGERMQALAGRLIGSLDPAARTSALSAALLRHAAAGEVAAPVADACRALAGRGPLAPAVTALAAVGHSSGEWLLRGLLIAAGAPGPPRAETD